jgi:hypothetical protein
LSVSEEERKLVEYNHFSAIINDNSYSYVW